MDNSICRNNFPFSNLIKIELKKQFTTKKIILVVSVLTISIICFGVFLKTATPDSELYEDTTLEEKQLYEQYENSSDWKERYMIQMQLNETLMSIYGEDYVQMQNSLLQYRIDNNIPPSIGGNNTYDFIEYVFSTLGFIFVLISIWFFSSTINIELKYKTEKLVYTKPYTRTAVLIAKLICAFIFIVLVFGFAIMLSWAVGGALFGFSGFSELNVIYFNNNVVCLSKSSVALAYMGLVFLNCIFNGIMSFSITSMFSSSIVGLSVTSVFFFLGNIVMQKLYSIEMHWTKWLFLSYTNLDVFIDTPIPVAYSFIIAVIIMTLTAGLLFVLSAVALSKRDIK